MRATTIKLLKENTDANFHDFGLGDGFLGHRKARAMKKKVGTLELIKVKNSRFRGPLRGQTAGRMGGNANHVSDEGLKSKMRKELSQLETKKTARLNARRIRI